MPIHYGKPSDDMEACDNSEVHVDNALSSLGVGRFHYRLFLLCGSGVAGDAMEKAAMMYILQAAKKQWNLEGTALGLLGSASGFGQVIGAFLFGRLSDSYGRRRSLLGALGLTLVLGLASAGVDSYIAFMVLRFAVNIGLAGAMPCAFTLLQECFPIHERTKWSALLYSCYGIGRILTALAAWVLLDFSWRIYMLAIALPGGVLLVCCRSLPESPHFLLAQGRQDEAKRMIEDIAAKNGSLSPISDKTRLLLDRQDTNVESRWKSLATPSAQILCMMWLLVSLGTEWFNWAVPIMLNNGAPASITYGSLLIFNTNELVVPLIIASLPKTLLARNSRGMLASSNAFAATSLASFGMSIFFELPVRLFIFLSIVAAYGGISVWVMHYNITPRYFPSRVRGTGFGMCQFFNRLGYIIGPLVASNLVDTHEISLLLACISCYFILLVFAQCLQPLSEAEGDDPSIISELSGSHVSS